MLKRLLIFSCLWIAYNASANNDIQNTILKLTKDEDLNIGIYIKSLDNTDTEFAFHGRRLFTPASTTKLFTAFMALNYLGPDYKFKTTVSADKKLDAKGELDSDLSIKFVGDPTFEYRDLISIFTDLKITSITGDIVIDGTMFDNNKNAPGGFTWDNHPFYYAAPNSAVIVDKNCSEAKMMPSGIGKIAKLTIERPYALSIDNTVDTVKKRKDDCPYKARYLGNNKYLVYGCMFNTVKPIRLNFALQDNDLMIKSYISHTLKDLNIKLKGKIRFSKAKGINILYTHESPPLKEVLNDVLQDSCNISSAAIFKHIAALHTKHEGTDEDGALLMKELLVKHGIKKSLFKIYDGAGESRYNLIAPEALVDLLSIIYKDPKLLEIFTASLPQYGEDGTLQNRKIHHTYSKHIYAKTGGLHCTSTLAGLYLPENKTKYAFAIMINNHNGNGCAVKSLIDDILEELLASMPS